VAATWVDAPVRAEIEARITDARPAVRLAAATALAARADGAVTAMLRLLDDPVTSVRDGVATLLRTRGGCTEALVDRLRHGSAREQLAVVAALGDDPGARSAVVGWAINQAARAETVRGYRAELPGADATPSRAYLGRVLQQREWRAVRGVLLAVESLAGRNAAQLLTRGARSDDPHLRAQAVEAIDSLADRPLTRHLLPLLEGEPAAGSAPRRVTAWAVLDDSDEWLRALAVRVAVEQIRVLRSLLDERVRHDGSALVADALSAAQEVAMSSQGRPSGLIDHVIALQRVPMFSDLAPEDLQQVAERCTSRDYRPGEVIYREGELGDEMLIITSGRVRISRAGRAEVVRRYGPGDHVGELSLLRGRPRVADVVADDEGAGGLALDAASFRAILDGRPEVAMAMLATLAERLGTM
jgi:hypothetical protein